MTDKELRRLSRSDLLEMLIAQTEENSQLKIRLEQAEKTRCLGVLTVFR